MIGMKQLLALTLLLSSCGIPGPVGPQGPRGEQGTPGTSCSVQQVDVSDAAPYGGAIITCGEASVLISNGAPGPRGEPGPITQHGILRTIDPCGDAPGIYDEVFLLVSDGTLLWSLSDNANGKNTRLAEAADGSWITTDGSDCTFTVATTGNYRTISWSGGSDNWEIQ